MIIIWYLSFWLTSLSVIISSSIHITANGIISFFFYNWVVFHCIYVPHLRKEEFYIQFFFIFQLRVEKKVLKCPMWNFMTWFHDCLGMSIYILLLALDLVSEKAMAPHSSTLAWKTPWMEEPGGLQSMRLLRVGHDWATSLSLFTFMHWRRKWQPTPGFLPGESQGRGSLVVCPLWGRTESDTTEVMQQQQQQQILYLLWCFSWGISLVFVLGKVFFFSKSAWLISVTFGGFFLLQSLLKIQIKFTHGEVERGKSSITNWWLGCYLCYAFKEF